MNPHFSSEFIPVAASVSGALLSAIWQGAALAAAVASALRFARGLTSAVRSLLWAGTFALVVLLHFTPFLHASAAQGTRHTAAVHLDSRWSVAFAGLWLVLSCFRLIQLAQSWIALRRIACSAREVESDAVPVELLRAGRRTARLCISEKVDRPSVLGFFSPRVLVPAELYQQLSAIELEHIVLHEMEHLRRRDDWVNLLQKLALALFPLNPAMLWVERQLSLERELACDDHVLAQTHARKTYATCLVNLAEHSMIRRRLSLALGAWERRSELARRVMRILHQTEGRMTTRRLRAVTAMLVAAMLGGTVQLAREPKLIAFTPMKQPTAQAEAVDTVIPGAASYVPAALRNEARKTHAVDAVFRVPPTMQPAAKRPLHAERSDAKTTKPRRMPHSFEASLRQPPIIAATQLAQAEPPVEISIPEGMGLHARQVGVSQPRNSDAVVVFATWTEYRAELPSDQEGGSARPTAASQSHQRIQLLIAHPIPSSYAAIPTADGWLILQL